MWGNVDVVGLRGELRRAGTGHADRWFTLAVVRKSEVSTEVSQRVKRGGNDWMVDILCWVVFQGVGHWMSY
jgi:hypothetical protein